jgi:hypothetical protein
MASDYSQLSDPDLIAANLNLPEDVEASDPIATAMADDLQRRNLDF